MKTFLVVNPKSAGGQTGRRWAELAAELSRGLGEFGHAFTEGPLHAQSLAARALKDGYTCVAAVGGDGTINEVVNGFFEEGRAINPQAALAVVPRGTGGDFRRTWGWDLKLRTAIDRMRAPETAPFDVGKVEFFDHEGKPQVRYFANICSFGVSGLVDYEVNQGSKALGGLVSFYVGTIKAMLKYRDRKVRLTLDDGPPKVLPVTTVAVANGRYFGGGMMVAPGADTADGWFDVTVWSGYRLTDFAVHSKSIYDGTHTRLKGTTLFRCRKLVAECDEDEVLLDVDGEQPGRLPCTVTLLPGAIRIKV